eukprot:CAMPEP_0206373270 /NCGR_PEP_ID=MMETSP0294-20121207/7605_1 /ASSEMBLY_ACC=CAM_ASM_000327 /TAXON_ID=39354 /ORGANISM="Heterosigma akashiwo, Strain CCMP2393" /LENGTH=139 /DNA_ID=CAMNT_0053820809 /DNA_START=214 /DNA_END=634 /DNA_ORIENTATION=-
MKRGAFLCCYVGEVITEAEYEAREAAKRRAGDETTYAIVIEAGGARAKAVAGDGGRFVIDSRYVGNVSRLMNHSCDANLVLRKIYTGKKYPSLAFFAAHDILPNEELTWHYTKGQADKKGTGRGIKCNCGAGAKCKGFL